MEGLPPGFIIFCSLFALPTFPPILHTFQAPVASLGVLVSWACSLLVAVSFLPALQGLGIGGVFMIFGVFTVLGLTLVATTAVGVGRDHLTCVHPSSHMCGVA